MSVVDYPEKDASKTFYGIPFRTRASSLRVEAPEVTFSLYYQMVMFFANGGGTCYIVSAGTYDQKSLIDKEKVVAALTALKKEQEITMVFRPRSRVGG